MSDVEMTFLFWLQYVDTHPGDIVQAQTKCWVLFFPLCRLLLYSYTTSNPNHHDKDGLKKEKKEKGEEKKKLLWENKIKCLNRFNEEKKEEKVTEYNEIDSKLYKRRTFTYYTQHGKGEREMGRIVKKYISLFTFLHIHISTQKKDEIKWRVQYFLLSARFFLHCALFFILLSLYI